MPFGIGRALGGIGRGVIGATPIGAVAQGLGFLDGKPGNVFTGTKPQAPSAQAFIAAPASPTTFPQLPAVGPGAGALGDLRDAYGALTGQGNQLGPQLPAPSGGSAMSLFGPPIQKGMATTRLQAPKGFVIVTITEGNDGYSQALSSGIGMPATKNGRPAVKFAMEKTLARKMGLWKPRPKPLLTRAEVRTIDKAARLQRKVATVAKKAGVSCRVPRKRR